MDANSDEAPFAVRPNVPSWVDFRAVLQADADFTYSDSGIGENAPLPLQTPILQPPVHVRMPIHDRPPLQQIVPPAPQNMVNIDPPANQANLDALFFQIRADARTRPRTAASHRSVRRRHSVERLPARIQAVVERLSQCPPKPSTPARAEPFESSLRKYRVSNVGPRHLTQPTDIVFRTEIRAASRCSTPTPSEAGRA